MKTNMPPQSKGRPDDFQTPPIALVPLLPYLESHRIIWECAAGKGNLAESLAKTGHSVIATDLYVGPSAGRMNFLTEEPQFPFDAVVTNPPFSDKDAFIARCYSFGRPFALLMPVTAIGGQRRQKLYREHGLQILMLGKRVNFETPSGIGGGAWQEHAWFTWGLNLPSDLLFSTLQGETK